MGRRIGKPGWRGARQRRRLRAPRFTQDQLEQALGIERWSLLANPCPCGGDRIHLDTDEEYRILAAAGGVPEGFEVISLPCPDPELHGTWENWVSRVGTDELYEGMVCLTCKSHVLVGPVPSR